MEPYIYRAKITRVIDGDTYEALLDIGFKLKFSVVLRVLSLDTYEVKDQLGKAAKTYATALLENRDVLVRTVKTDSFGRWLADVYLDNKSVAEIMKYNGFSKPVY